MSSVPVIQFTATGVVLPQESAILAGAQDDMDAAFGGGLNPGLSTPQGQLATSQTAVIADKNTQIAYVANQVDPRYASGRWQDAIGYLYFMTRIGATSTAVTCTLGGPVGSSISAGVLAQDTSGNTYSLLGTVTIGSGGTVSSSWQNVVTGPIPCPAGTLTKVYQAAGFDTITNPDAGVLGQNVETPAEFELRRQNSVAVNSRGSKQAVQASVFGVANVLDCYVIDNTSGLTVPTGSSNYPMLPHSIYVAVVGGVDADVANAIWLKKDDGCDYNGNTTVVVYDTTYSVPQPSYPVKFERPASTPVLFAVQISNSNTLPSNIVALIQATIVAQFTGTNPAIPPARIASAITGANYYGAVIGAAPNVTVLSVLVGITAPTLTQVTMGIDQSPTISAANISVSLV